MSTQTVTPPQRAAPDEAYAALRARPRKIIIGLIGMAVVVWALANLFLAFGYYPERFGNKIVIALLAIVAGVAGAALLFWFLNMFVEGLPERLTQGVIPYAFLIPGLLFVALMLIYPTFQSINYSFANSDSTAYVGLQNYRTIFSDSEFWNAIINNILWLIIVPAFVVAFGVVVAVLSDKLSANGEKFAKSLIFLPMAISAVSASAIWLLVYAYNNPGQAQTGLLNAIWVALGGEPQAWLQIETAKLNSILLMVILIWLQAGFAMVLLSSAIKGVPEDTLEAARIDGASEWQIFWRVVIPQIMGTIITVFVTVFITVLKVFDIVYVTTNGAYNTNVIANLFFNKLFGASEAGQASAIVVVLLVAVIPLIWFQIRHFRSEETNR
ncbi:sugar ABC transporter permease [Intrasporangium sp.]|uniref:carbohydrate ABC transporter permease n=1 Tax=Intrasporangium sp. TaxID=1925024 RepID=UPI0033658211